MQYGVFSSFYPLDASSPSFLIYDNQNIFRLYQSPLGHWGVENSCFKLPLFCTLSQNINLQTCCLGRSSGAQYLRWHSSCSQMWIMEVSVSRLHMSDSKSSISDCWESLYFSIRDIFVCISSVKHPPHPHTQACMHPLSNGHAWCFQMYYFAEFITCISGYHFLISWPQARVPSAMIWLSC